MAHDPALSVRSIEKADISNLMDQFVSIYRDVFSQPPYSESETDAIRFAGQLERHMIYPEFRCAVATTGDVLLGFAYGYLGQAGQYFRDHLRWLIDETNYELWIVGSFEFVELAVVAEARGRGIGSRLHDLLLDGVPAQTAVLATYAGETPARQMYRRRGWVSLYRGNWAPDSRYQTEILALDLTRRGGEALPDG